MSEFSEGLRLFTDEELDRWRTTLGEDAQYAVASRVKHARARAAERIEILKVLLGSPELVPPNHNVEMLLDIVDDLLDEVVARAKADFDAYLAEILEGESDAPK